MSKKKWRAKRAVTVRFEAGDEYEKEYSLEEEELLLERGIVEEVTVAPKTKVTVAASKTVKTEGGKDGKN